MRATTSDILTPDFKPDPYWWDAAPPVDAEAQTLPSKVDVVVVGSGFTGLSAALALARGGRQVVVLEASRLGQGASTRNNGALVPYLYLKLDALMKQFGESRGVTIAMTAVQSLEYFLSFLDTEGIDCGLEPHERYFLALSPSHLDGLKRLVDLYPQHGIDIGWESLPKDQLADETGLDNYAGAVVARRALAIHPGICHAALLARVKQAGATLIDCTEVVGVGGRATNGLRVQTNRGPIDAGEVIVATNGYTGAAFPWARRRLISLRVFKAASEILSPALRDEIFPTRRFFVNTRHNHTVIRLTPDGQRFIVGGRAGMSGVDARVHAATLYRDMVELDPRLRSVRLSHCWDCRMGWTFDKLPFVGEHEGVHYAVGFCGVGVTMGSWLGSRLAKRILGERLPPTVYDDRRFPTRPFYHGQQWPVTLAMAWFNLKDRLAG